MPGQAIHTHRGAVYETEVNYTFCLGKYFLYLTVWVHSQGKRKLVGCLRKITAVGRDWAQGTL